MEKTRLHAGKDDVRVTVSVGVAGEGASSFRSLEGILGHADQALYAAKAQGRNRVVVTTAELLAEATG